MATPNFGFDKIPFGSPNYPSVMDEFMDEVDLYLGRMLSSSRYASIQAAITAIGAAEVTLAIHTSIPAATTAVAVTVPANIVLAPINPGVITKGSATSLTINSAPVGNSMHQWLNGFAAGEVFITSMIELPAIWLGNNVAAINLAIDTSDGNGDVRVQPGIINVNTIINIDQTSVKLKGSGSGDTTGTILQKSADAIARAVYLTSLYGGLEDVLVDCNSKTLDGVALTTANYNVLKNVHIQNTGGTGWGLVINNASVNRFYDVHVIDCINGIDVGGSTGSNCCGFYGCSAHTNGSSGTALRLYSSAVTHSAHFFNLLLDPGTGMALEVTNAADSGIWGLYLEAAFLNTVDLVHITGANTINFTIDTGIISQTHASFNQNLITIDGDPVNVSLKNLYLQKASNNTTPLINLDDVTGVKLENITTYIATAHNIITTSANSVGVICENIRATASTATVSLAGTSHKWVGGTSNITITIINGASNIIIENFPGSIIVQNNTTGIELINCTGTVTDDSYRATQRRNGTYITPWRTIASATELVLGDGEHFEVTGTTSITSITSADSIPGRKIRLMFQDVLTLTDGSNLKLAGNFVTSADDTINLTCYGSGVWFENSRSAN